MSTRATNINRGLLRLGIGIALIAFVIWWVGIDKVRSGLAAIHPLWIIPILGAAYLGIAISCLRWRILLAARGIRASLHRLVFYYIIGYFFSSFLPGMFGGDIVRSYVFGKRIENQTESFASVFVERLSGLAGMIIVASGAAILNIHTLVGTGLLPAMGAIIIGFFLFIVLLFNRPLVERIGTRINWRRLSVLKAKLLTFHEAVCFFRTRKKVVFTALLYSIIFQLFTSVNTYIVCLALGIDLPLLDIMVVLPVILLICSLPTTPNAAGVWEITFTVFFSRLGLTAADATNIALVLRAKNIVIALLGGGFYLASGHYAKRTGGE